MLKQAETLNGYKLDSLDGEIGKVKEFYFDDRHWTIRYLVAETGDWLTDRQVLISPYALEAVNTKDEQIQVKLSKQQIEDSPAWQSDKPVSRQFEESYYEHYDWPTYWGGGYNWGAYPFPTYDTLQVKKPNHVGKDGDHDLRSTSAVRGYHIQASNGEIGHVDDFIIDDKTWAIRYLVIDTKNWWSGKKVLISPQWIERVSWSESKVFINLTRAMIKQAPEYTEAALLNREYEIALHSHYNRQAYWDENHDNKITN